MGNALQKPLPVRLTDKQREKVEAIATQAGVKVSVVIRWMIEAYEAPSFFLPARPVNSQNDEIKSIEPVAA